MAKGFLNLAPFCVNGKQMVGVGRNVPMDKGPSLPTCRPCCLDFRVIRIIYDIHTALLRTLLDTKEVVQVLRGLSILE